MDTHIKGIAVKATTRKTNKQKKTFRHGKISKNMTEGNNSTG